ncbi:MAG TPA: isochorismatase family protein [Roseiarcus sp.]|jgi:nicotinamidase-related amidase|nr:isochorismatase family protein [Roseiarcus sp.]
MRLPADAVLMVVDAEEPAHPDAGDPRQEADSKIAALIAAWRAEGLPLVHVARRSAGAARPRDGETVIAREAMSAFAGTSLEERLDELGATTLVLCGALATHALEATARHAGDLGYRVFVVADACRAAEAVDLNGRSWPAEDVRALALAHLEGETATMVDSATALGAAATARARQRRKAGRA